MNQPDATYELLKLLDRLEELRDEMLELDVASMEEIESRIRNLESQLSDLPDGDDDGPV